MTRGKFLAFEGGEGAGKSTQVQMLAQELEKRGIDVDLTREPGGTEGAEAIRALLLDPPGDGWGARAEALLFAAARSDHVAKRIMPALDRGEWVISDRFVGSSRAYQGGAGELGDEAITTLHQIGSEGLKPDLTILIEADPERVAKRLAERDGDNSDAIGGRSIAYHSAVSSAFRDLAMAEPDLNIIIDGNGTPQQVHERVLSAIVDRFGI